MIVLESARTIIELPASHIAKYAYVVRVEFIISYIYVILYDYVAYLVVVAGSTNVLFTVFTPFLNVKPLRFRTNC
ncbi:hypothetical protein [Thermoplasma volcanium]|uniref:hypothetical protein n=1 Tax=Thermoplasma volcanium TaxID=50339 RepID=UPI0012EA0C47|nr:hypothetical protein [Thermoplasma volcanium]